MSTVYTPLIGRFGNQLFQYCHARAVAEREKATLCTPEWVGERIFDIPEACREKNASIVLGGYGQTQDCLIYTRKQVKEWLRLRPGTDELYSHLPTFPCLAHRRVGDLLGYGYPQVSERSYYNALSKFGLPPLQWVTEEAPEMPGWFPEYPFLADFLRMMKCKNLLRGNSSFSWWAATLGNARVFAPIIEGKEGGKEHDCEFVESNAPKFCEHPLVSDLVLREE